MDHAALIRCPGYPAVLASPDADAPRMALAAALAAAGDVDRARFVVLQLDDARRAPRRPRVADRDDEILALARAHPEWAEGLPEIPGVGWGHGRHLGYVRGLPGRVVVRGRRGLVDGLAAALAVAPVCEVQAEGCDDDALGALGDAPELACLRELRFGASCVVGFAGARALAASPFAGGLRAVSFHRDVGLDADGVGVLRERFGDRLDAVVARNPRSAPPRDDDVDPRLRRALVPVARALAAGAPRDVRRIVAVIASDGTIGLHHDGIPATADEDAREAIAELLRAGEFAGIRLSLQRTETAWAERYEPLG